MSVGEDGNVNLPSQICFRNLGSPITFEGVGQRIDVYLASHFRFRSRSQWSKVCRVYEVRANHRPVPSSYRLKRGDRLDYYCPESAEPPVDDRLELVWQDGPMMAVAKPANLPMHEAGAYRLHTFAAALQTHFGPEWAAIHRLDRETSGLVLCGATAEARAQLSELIYHRHMTKHYFALLKGGASEDQWTMDAPMGETTKTTFRTKQWVHTPQARPALTLFKVLDRGTRGTLVQATPVTGRTHQIRVHAAYKGLPLVGDKKYVADETIYLEYLDQGFTERVKAQVLSERLCLHAGRLEFRHPVSGQQVIVERAIPEDMKGVWETLKKETEVAGVGNGI